MHDLTAEIAQVVSNSRIRIGVANIFNVGSTGAVGTIEFEPGLQQDLPAMLDKLFPPSRDCGHEQAWRGSHSWPTFLNSPTNSFFLVSMDTTVCQEIWNLGQPVTRERVAQHIVFPLDPSFLRHERQPRATTTSRSATRKRS
jgi:hypothetical protein